MKIVDNLHSVFADKVKKDMKTKTQIKPLEKITDDLTKNLKTLEKHRTDSIAPPETPDSEPF